MTLKILEEIPAANIMVFDVEELSKAPLCYAHGSAEKKEHGIQVCLSGMIGVDGKGALVGEGALEQTKQTLVNIATALTVVGEHFRCPHSSNALLWITKTRIDVVDISTNGMLINQGYVESSMRQRPRALIGVSSLPLGAKVEITAEAFLPYAPSR